MNQKKKDRRDRQNNPKTRDTTRQKKKIDYQGNGIVYDKSIREKR